MTSHAHIIITDISGSVRATLSLWVFEQLVGAAGHVGCGSYAEMVTRFNSVAGSSSRAELIKQTF